MSSITSKILFCFLFFLELIVKTKKVFEVKSIIHSFITPPFKKELCTLTCN